MLPGATPTSTAGDKLTARARLLLLRRHISMGYTAVPLDSFGSFPCPFGVTTSWGPSTLELTAAPSGQDVTLTLKYDAYSAELHPSRGVAAGSYYVGGGMLRDRQWSGEIDRALAAIAANGVEIIYAKGLADGPYQAWLSIDDQMAQEVKIRELEHVADFGAAWELTVGRLQWAVDQVKPQQEPAALTELANVLLSAGFNYLLPATPGIASSWGPRAKQVYDTLCGQSDKRDHRREHSSKSYTITLAEDGKSIWLQPQMKDPHPDSQAYIKTDEVPLAFSGGTFDAATATASPNITVGKVVTWQNESVNIGLSDHESEFHEEQNLSDNWGDIPGIKAAIKQGAEVSALDNDYVWLKINLSELDKNILQDARRLDWTECYVHVRTALLREK